jgi:proteasome lid subunit RPN8/RPN11
MYPEECCGSILGRTDGDAAVVVRVEALDNARSNQRHRRFLISANDFRQAELEAERLGVDLLGFYHSHPEHPARPSEFDRLHAWPNLHYVIVAVALGVAGDVTSWQLTEDREAFREETILCEE